MTLPVKESVVQKPWISSADERGDVDEEERGDRGRDLPERLQARPAPGEPGERAEGSPARGALRYTCCVASTGRPYPLICCQAVVQAFRSVQFFWPLPQSAIGVFQNLIDR